jgi:hypothetical protein
VAGWDVHDESVELWRRVREECARVERLAPASRCRLEPGAHDIRAPDQLLDLRQLALGERLKLGMRGFAFGSAS